jgi:hypothetical protein
MITFITTVVTTTTLFIGVLCAEYLKEKYDFYKAQNEFNNDLSI